MTTREPLFPEWSDLVDRADADRECIEQSAIDDDRTCRAPLLATSAPPSRLALIRMRAMRRES